MIVLDTNLVSELMKPLPAPAVVSWVDRQDASDLMLTALTAAELRAGVAVLPDGRRRREVVDSVENLLTDTFAGYILPFDSGSSRHYAEIVALRRRVGRPIGILDAQIAAVCREHEAVLATRNIRDFDGTGVEVVNPWEPA